MNTHPPSQRTILLVEDDRDLARLVQFYLARESFEVRHAIDGEQALQEFDLPHRPDVVILDVMMPYRNGYELLADLRRRPAWNHVPVIMLTNCGREEDVVQGLDLGASDYVIKPFRPSELIARIRKVLRPALKAG